MPKVTVRVRPGSRAPRVGGAFGTPPALVVAVAEPAVGGRANAAVTRALAEAFDVPATCVSIVAGGVGRTKIVAVEADPARVQSRLEHLLHS